MDQGEKKANPQREIQMIFSAIFTVPFVCIRPREKVFNPTG
jgi:hypothetical protein